jgi:hypothetical protein
MAGCQRVFLDQFFVLLERETLQKGILLQRFTVIFSTYIVGYYLEGYVLPCYVGGNKRQ